MTLLHRALQDERGFGGQKIDMAEDLLRAIAVFANGDARTALSTLEMVILNADLDENGLAHVTPETVAQCTSRRSLLYDKKGDGHYDLISALHKSMRNSDPDAAVYWLARMLESGEDPLYIARRVVRFASEDIGLADSRALETAVAAYQACHFLGMPECTVHLTQAVVYMAMAPKSNALYVAYETAKKDAQEQIAEPVPLQIRNAETSLMKNLGYGKGYVYAHDTQEKLSAMTCLPDSLQGKRYYQPTEQGNEGRYKQRLEEIIGGKRNIGGNKRKIPPKTKRALQEHHTLQGSFVWSDWKHTPNHSSFLRRIISSVRDSSTNPCFRKRLTAGLSMAISSYRTETPLLFAAEHSKSNASPP